MFFFGLVFAAAGSVVASPLSWTTALLLCGSAALAQSDRFSPGITALGTALWIYVLWVIANGFVNTTYTSAAIFHPALLAAGFMAWRAFGARARHAAAAAVLAAMALLACWALWQAASGQGRAHAHFETPNTLATVLNLALAPLLFRIAYGDSRRGVLGLALLLTAALVSTLSRGGFIALACGLLTTSLLFHVRPSRDGVARSLSVLGSGAIAGVIAMQAPLWLTSHAIAPEAQLQGIASTLGSTLDSRIELYRLALWAVGEHPWLGTGYLGFNPLFEAHRAQLPSYTSENVTYFVHNDYLQTLVELGLPGLMALLAIVMLPFGLARRSAPPAMERLSLYAPLAGIATMAIHALGDFPFYVPLCLLLFGASLGEVDRRLAQERRTAPRTIAPRAGWVTIGGAALIALLLLPPPLAEAAAWYGERGWRKGIGESAALGFELARRLQPHDWRYHWYAGQFWYAQAQAGNRAAAQLADEAFAAAIQANPADPRPLLGRIAVQLRFAKLLEQPQAAGTLRGWAERALALAPLNPAVRQDYAAALAQLEAPR